MLPSMTSLIPQSFLPPTTCNALTHYTPNVLTLSRLLKTTKCPLIPPICLTENVLTVHLRMSAFITAHSCQVRSTLLAIHSSSWRKIQVSQGQYLHRHRTTSAPKYPILQVPLANNCFIPTPLPSPEKTSGMQLPQPPRIACML
eukprot:CCRYP_013899-RA/>CCRYP_013899-RA protein AED:0.19 eAED:0.32 QI:439/0/0.5/1/0/0/2/0/143